MHRTPYTTAVCVRNDPRPASSGLAMDLVFDIEVPASSNGTVSVVSSFMATSSQNGVVFTIDIAAAAMAGGRGGSGGARTGTLDGNIHFPILATETAVRVRVLVDRSIVEIFVQGGRVAKTVRAYPKPGSNQVWLEATSPAGATVSNVTAFSMGCGWE